MRTAWPFLPFTDHTPLRQVGVLTREAVIHIHHHLDALGSVALLEEEMKIVLDLQRVHVVQYAVSSAP